MAVTASAAPAPTPTPPPSAMISIGDFCAWYSDFQALHNLNLEIPEKRVTAFIGPSGCGKSTLLKWRIVFQKPNPFPKTIYDNISFGPRLHFAGLKKPDLDDLVKWSLQKAALWDEVKDRLHKSALGLSGGQQQRLCIARAIAIGPEILRRRRRCHRGRVYST